MPYKLSAKAEDDIISLFVYGIDTHGRMQAMKYRDGLERTLELIADTPFIGRQYRGEIRRFLFGNHIIFYEVQEEGIFVLRIRHHAVDPDHYL